MIGSAPAPPTQQLESSICNSSHSKSKWDVTPSESPQVLPQTGGAAGPVDATSPQTAAEQQQEPRTEELEPHLQQLQEAGPWIDVDVSQAAIAAAASTAAAPASPSGADDAGTLALMLPLPGPPPLETQPEVLALKAVVMEQPRDFDAWSALLALVDTGGCSTEEAIELYQVFLGEFPLCWGYWKRLADAQPSPAARLQIYERAAAGPAVDCIDMWAHFCSAAADAVEVAGDDEASVLEAPRKIFERAIEACGLDWRAGVLWERYMDFEERQGDFERLVGLFRRALAVPMEALPALRLRLRALVIGDACPPLDAFLPAVSAECKAAELKGLHTAAVLAARFEVAAQPGGAEAAATTKAETQQVAAAVAKAAAAAAEASAAAAAAVAATGGSEPTAQAEAAPEAAAPEADAMDWSNFGLACLSDSDSDDGEISADESGDAGAAAPAAGEVAGSAQPPPQAAEPAAVAGDDESSDGGSCVPSSDEGEDPMPKTIAVVEPSQGGAEAGGQVETRAEHMYADDSDDEDDGEISTDDQQPSQANVPSVNIAPVMGEKKIAFKVGLNRAATAADGASAPPAPHGGAEAPADGVAAPAPPAPGALSTKVFPPIDPKKERFLSHFDVLYDQAAAQAAELRQFEAALPRPYFHNKPLSEAQLDVWRRYLNFEESRVPRFERRLHALYRRCLVAANNYMEFWIRYATWLEQKGGPSKALELLGGGVSTGRLRGRADAAIVVAELKEELGFVTEAKDLLDEVLAGAGRGSVELAVRRVALERRAGNLERCRELLVELAGTAPGVDAKAYLSRQLASLLEVEFGQPREAYAVLSRAWQGGCHDACTLVELAALIMGGAAADELASAAEPGAEPAGPRDRQLAKAVVLFEEPGAEPAGPRDRQLAKAAALFEEMLSPQALAAMSGPEACELFTCYVDFLVRHGAPVSNLRKVQTRSRTFRASLALSAAANKQQKQQQRQRPQPGAQLAVATKRTFGAAFGGQLAAIGDKPEKLARTALGA